MGESVDEMVPGDYGQVAALWEEVGMWPHVGEDQAWLEGAIARNPGCALVFRQEGRVVGTVVGAWDGMRGWIYHLAVTESHRNRGIGNTLLEAAEQRLREVGVRQINIMVYEDNAYAEGWYLGRGYERSPVKVVRKRFDCGAS